MVAAVRAGKFDVVAVLRLDRAFRSVVYMHGARSEPDGRGVRSTAVTLPVEIGTAIGRSLVNVLGSVGEQLYVWVRRVTPARHARSKSRLSLRRCRRWRT